MRKILGITGYRFLIFYRVMVFYATFILYYQLFFFFLFYSIKKIMKYYTVLIKKKCKHISEWLMSILGKKCISNHGNKFTRYFSIISKKIFYKIVTFQFAAIFYEMHSLHIIFVRYNIKQYINRYLSRCIHKNKLLSGFLFMVGKVEKLVFCPIATWLENDCEYWKSHYLWCKDVFCKMVLLLLLQHTICCNIVTYVASFTTIDNKLFYVILFLYLFIKSQDLTFLTSKWLKKI